MTVLLDTCIFLWMSADPGQLSSPARSVLEDSANRRLFSSISALEITIKVQLGN